VGTTEFRKKPQTFHRVCGFFHCASVGSFLNFRCLTWSTLISNPLTLLLASRLYVTPPIKPLSPANISAFSGALLRHTGLAGLDCLDHRARHRSGRIQILPRNQAAIDHVEIAAPLFGVDEIAAVLADRLTLPAGTAPATMVAPPPAGIARHRNAWWCARLRACQ